MGLNHSLVRLSGICACLALVSGVVSGCGFEVVDTGYRGIETSFGKVTGGPYREGLYFYNPLTSNIEEIDVREQKWETELNGPNACYTKDTQKVEINLTVNYRLDESKVISIFRDIGMNYETKVFHTRAVKSLKDTIGQYKADDLVGQRALVATAIQKELEIEAGSRGIIITGVSLVNIKFDDAYEKAVEAKAVQVQTALTAANKTIEIQEQAKQKIVSAEAEAKSMEIRSEALSKNKGLVEWEAVQVQKEFATRWNGALPQYVVGSNVPMMLNMPLPGAK